LCRTWLWAASRHARRINATGWDAPKLNAVKWDAAPRRPRRQPCWDAADLAADLAAELASAEPASAGDVTAAELAAAKHGAAASAVKLYEVDNWPAELRAARLWNASWPARHGAAGYGPSRYGTAWYGAAAWTSEYGPWNGTTRSWAAGHVQFQQLSIRNAAELFCFHAAPIYAARFYAAWWYAGWDEDAWLCSSHSGMGHPGMSPRGVGSMGMGQQGMGQQGPPGMGHMGAARPGMFGQPGLSQSSNGLQGYSQGIGQGEQSHGLLGLSQQGGRPEMSHGLLGLSQNLGPEPTHGLLGLHTSGATSPGARHKSDIPPPPGQGPPHVSKAAAQPPSMQGQAQPPPPPPEPSSQPGVGSSAGAAVGSDASATAREEAHATKSVRPRKRPASEELEYSVQRALDLQTQLHKGFADAPFQDALKRLQQRYPDRKKKGHHDGTAYFEAFESLTLSVHARVLPDWGLTADWDGVREMICRMADAMKHNKVKNMQEEINVLMGLPRNATFTPPSKGEEIFLFRPNRDGPVPGYPRQLVMDEDGDECHEFLVEDLVTGELRLSGPTALERECWYQVLHRPAVVIRARPDVKSDMVGRKKHGRRLRVQRVVDGKWLQLHQSELTRLGVQEAWALLDGAEMGLAGQQLLEKVM